MSLNQFNYPADRQNSPKFPHKNRGVKKCVENVMLSSVADEVRKSWIKISSYMETVHIPSRKQNVLIPPPEGLVSLRVAD
jgi:hypothetical protein